MTSAPFIPLARIVKTHGLDGEVSVMYLTEPPFSLPVGLHIWLVPPPARVRDGVIESVRPGPKGPLVKISGINDIAAASQIRGTTITARREDISDYLVEPLPTAKGLSVSDTERGLLGRVEDVIETGANDVWVVRGPIGEVLIPVIDTVILDVDDENRTATVKLLPGLIEETD